MHRWIDAQQVAGSAVHWHGSDWLRGLLAASVATAALTAMVALTHWAGLVPELDIVSMLARIAGESRGIGWLLYLAVGVFGYGLALPLLSDGSAEFSPLRASLWLCAVGWFGTMMALLPMAGYTPFAIGLGLAGPLLAALWFALFGAVLGWTWLQLPAAQAWMLRTMRAALQRMPSLPQRHA